MSTRDLADDGLARLMFDAYSAQAGGVTWDGKPIPPFDAVGPKVQASWIAAARAAREALVPVTLSADVHPEGPAATGDVVSLAAAADASEWWTLAYETDLKGRGAKLTREHFEQIVRNAGARGRDIPVVLNHADTDPAAHPDSRKAHAWLSALRIGSMEVAGKTVATLEGKRRWVNDATRADVAAGALACGSVTVFFRTIDDVSGKDLGASLWSFSLTNNPALAHLPALAASQAPASLTPPETPHMNKLLPLATLAGLTTTDEAAAATAVESRVAESNDLRTALNLSATAPTKDVVAQVATLSAAAARLPKLEVELAAFRRAADEAAEKERTAHLGDVMLAAGLPDAVRPSLDLHARSDWQGFQLAYPRPSREELAQRAQDGARLARVTKATGAAPSPSTGADGDQAPAADIDAAVTELMQEHDCSYAEALDMLGAQG
jgi:hypothetical protein